MNELRLFINWRFILRNCILFNQLYGFWSFPYWSWSSLCRSFQCLLESINFEMPPPQNCFSLEPAQLVSPSLVGPNPLQVECIVAPSCSRPCSRANHLQPAQQKLCLGPDSHHGQRWQGFWRGALPILAVAASCREEMPLPCMYVYVLSLCIVNILSNLAERRRNQ